MFYLFVEVCSFSFFFVFFKQKTAYEMRISDWSSDVCSSDLPPLESMACGVLPLCSNRSAIPEVVGEAGVLLDPDHPEAFTDALRQAIEDPAWEIGRASCRERACQ